MIKEKSKVTIAYKLYADGNLIESRDLNDPLEFIIGVSTVFENIQKIFIDKNINENVEYEFNGNEIVPEYSEDYVIKSAISDLFGDIEITDELKSILYVGNIIPVTYENQQFMACITEVNDEEVILDFNHPFANKTIKISASILNYVDLSDEEIAAEIESWKE